MSGFLGWGVYLFLLLFFFFGKFHVIEMDLGLGLCTEEERAVAGGGRLGVA